MFYDELIAQLESLRGKHDQTMRCGAIKVVYGKVKRNGMTPTQQFLEDQIAAVKKAKHHYETDILDQE